MARKASFKVDFDAISFEDYTYPADSKKAGQTVKRAVINTLAEALKFYAGNEKGILSACRKDATAQFAANLENPDQAYLVPAKRLAKAGKLPGVTFADSENPTADEMRSAVAALKTILGE